MNRKSFISSVCAATGAAIIGTFTSRASVTSTVNQEILPTCPSKRGKPYTLWLSTMVTPSDMSRDDVKGITPGRFPITGSTSEEIVAQALINIAYICAYSEVDSASVSSDGLASRVNELIRSAGKDTI